MRPSKSRVRRDSSTRGVRPMASTAERSTLCSLIESEVITFTKRKKELPAYANGLQAALYYACLAIHPACHSQECQAVSTSATLAGFLYSNYPQATIAYSELLVRGSMVHSCQGPSINYTNHLAPGRTCSAHHWRFARFCSRLDSSSECCAPQAIKQAIVENVPSKLSSNCGCHHDSSKRSPSRCANCCL